jgi:hypothetical protein
LLLLLLTFNKLLINNKLCSIYEKVVHKKRKTTDISLIYIIRSMLVYIHILTVKVDRNKDLVLFSQWFSMCILLNDDTLFAFYTMAIDVNDTKLCPTAISFTEYNNNDRRSAICLTYYLLFYYNRSLSICNHTYIYLKVFSRLMKWQNKKRTKERREKVRRDCLITWIRSMFFVHKYVFFFCFGLVYTYIYVYHIYIWPSSFSFFFSFLKMKQTDELAWICKEGEEKGRSKYRREKTTKEIQIFDDEYRDDRIEVRKKKDVIEFDIQINNLKKNNFIILFCSR